MISEQNDTDTLDAFTYDTYTIVGLTDSTTYLNMERGTTKLAGGKISAFVYLPRRVLDGLFHEAIREIHRDGQNLHRRL